MRIISTLVANFYFRRANSWGESRGANNGKEKSAVPKITPGDSSRRDCLA